MDLLQHFERLVSRRQTAERGFNVRFQIPRRGMSYRSELVAAKQLIKRTHDYLKDLHQDTSHDLELALTALELLFTDRQFSWKTYSTLITMHKDFQLALAIVIAREKERLRKEKQELEVARRAMQGENIFN